MNEKKKHLHQGMTSRSFLDADYVMTVIGLKPGNVFLDAGCGDGHMSFAAARVVGRDGRVYAVDSYEESLDAVRGEIRSWKVDNVEPLLADITAALPIPDASVDVFFLSNVLHGLVENEEIVPAFGEIVRVLKRGGTLAVVDYKKEDTPLGPPLSVRLTPDEVSGIIAGYGFITVKAEPVGAWHYALTARKT
jgi:ubiquinone/menaquinone biosynthesis C-methylase UbiE